jgi:hypothetical protein
VPRARTIYLAVKPLDGGGRYGSVPFNMMLTPLTSQSLILPGAIIDKISVLEAATMPSKVILRTRNRLIVYILKKIVGP